MNARYEGHSVRRTWIQSGLLLLAATTLNGSLWALPFPRSFYEDFPLSGRDWVSTLGPYDEHLVRDYGALNLALGVLLVAAAVYLERRLAQVALVTWLVFEVPHFVFHLGQTHHFSVGSNLAQLGGLALLIVLPLVLLLLLPQRAAGRDPGRTDVNRTERIETR